MVQELFHPDILAFLFRGLMITLEIAFFSLIFSMFFGMVLGVARFSDHKILSPLAAIYVDSVRNLPSLLFILAARFLTTLPPIYSAILAMSVFGTAIVAEIIRGGLNSVGKGQWEAAKSQGFSFYKTLRYVIMPQAMRNMIPPLMSQTTTIIKDTSFAWAVGIEELTGSGMIIMGKYNSTPQVFALFGMIAAIYFIINYLLSAYSRNLHKSLAHRSF